MANEKRAYSEHIPTNYSSIVRRRQERFFGDFHADRLETTLI